MASSLASSLLVISLLIGVCYSFEDGAMKCVHDPNKVKVEASMLSQGLTNKLVGL